DGYFQALGQRAGAGVSIDDLDPRFALERAIAQEQRCPREAKPEGRAPMPIDRDCLAEAARLFAIAARNPATVAEANTRGAWVQFQRGAFAEALATIGRAETSEDQDVAYWAALFRGRILDALGRNREAEQSYRAALKARPFAQSANVVLAVTL